MKFVQQTADVAGEDSWRWLWRDRRFDPSCSRTSFNNKLDQTQHI